MRSKLGLYVCPHPECAVVAIKPLKDPKCPRHGDALVREVYVRRDEPTPISDRQKKNIRKILDKMPDALRPRAEQQAREMGYL